MRLFGYSLAMLFLIVGVATVQGSAQILSQPKQNLGIFQYIIIGMSIWSGCLNLLSLWLSVSSIMHFIASGAAVLLLLLHYPAIKKVIMQAWCNSYLWIKLIFFIFGFFTVLQSVPITAAMDEGGYYIQTILWMQQYPSVPGLGNLSVTLAYNSAWHKLGAFWWFTEKYILMTLMDFYI
ncbi:MAG: hypothetical protein HC913_07090 [Microscillaceae bacterium]|nr:hypothetical protein [Microscillaceae bacterium]